MTLVRRTITALLALAGTLPAQQPDRERGLDLPSGTSETHIEFGPGQSATGSLHASGRKQLTHVLAILRSPQWRHRNVVIEGHTCGCRRAGEAEGIGQRRAAEVRDYLVSEGVVPTRSVYLRPFARGDLPDAASREDLPRDRCETDEVHAMDRRVTVRELAPEDLQPPVRLVKPSPDALLAQVSMWYRPAGERGRFRRLLNDEALQSGDEISLFLTAARPLYAYVFHLGSGGEWACLYPKPSFSLDAPAVNPIEPGRKYWLPRFGGGAPLDDTPGPEETFVLLSETADERLERWVEEGVPHITVSQSGDGAGPASAGLVQAVPDTAGIAWHTRVRFRHEVRR